MQARSKRLVRLACMLLGVVALVLKGQLAWAQARPAPPELVWNEGDAGFGWANLALLGVTGGVALVGQFVEPDRDDPWRETLGVDEEVRSGLRLSDASQRRAARTTSDVLAGVVVAYPIVLEAGVNAWWAKSSRRVGLELAGMQLEVLGLNAALVNTSKWLFSRERPYGRLCGSELASGSKDCRDDDRYLSYFSGHASFTFASVTAQCVQHVRWRLWGDVPAWVPCGTGYALAATTALLRMAADRHYVSDVTTGAVVGTAIGLAVPWLHYRASLGGDPRAQVNVGFNGAGVFASGSF